MSEFRLQSKSMYLLNYFERDILVNIPKVYSLYRSEIQKNIIYLNENIIRANINEGNIRKKSQKEVMVNIAMLDLYLSILLNLDIICKKKFMHVSRLLNETRKMCAGWIKNEEEK